MIYPNLINNNLRYFPFVLSPILAKLRLFLVDME